MLAIIGLSLFMDIELHFVSLWYTNIFYYVSITNCVLNEVPILKIIYTQLILKDVLKEKM